MNWIVSSHKLFDVLKQYQNEVNEIHVDKIAKNANPLTLVAAAKQYLDPYYQAPKSHKSYAPPSKQSSSTRSHASTKYKGKEIAKPIKPSSEKPKRVKDYTYHKKKMLCKQAEKGVPLQVEQADWLANTDKEIDEQILEAQYSYMAKIQEVSTTDLGNDTEPLEKVQYDAEYNVFANERQHSKQPESISNTCVVKKVDSIVILDSSNMCDNDIQTDQNAEECDDERVVLAILTLDTKENKKNLNQLKEIKCIIDSRIKKVQIQSQGV
nr:hypothetical protein [Tanacetum cinerariifolium]